MGTFFFILILIIIIAVALVCASAFSKTNKEGVEYNVSNKVIKENNPKINDEVTFWVNPRNNRINIYFNGSVGGNGKIGEINSKPDLKKYNEGNLHAYICKITDNSVFIKFY